MNGSPSITQTAPDTPAPIVSEEGIGLTHLQFNRIFPFHIVIGPDGHVNHSGSSILRLQPELARKPQFTSVFRILRPVIEFSMDALLHGSGFLFLVQVIRTGMSLRGQMLPVGDGSVVFLASPWLVEADTLRQFDLSIDDFAIHDPALDLFQSVQAQKIAIGDLQRLNDRLKRQRSELAAVNAQLAEQNAALRAAQKQLEASEAEARKLALLAARTSNAVVVTDAQGKIEWVNDAFVRIAGYTLDEVMGKTPGQFLQGPETDPETVERMHRAVVAGREFNVEVLNYSKSGRKYWVHIEAQPILEADGRVIHFMAIETDVTDRVEADRRKGAQFDVSCILADAEIMNGGIARIIEAIALRFGWNFGAFWSVDHGVGHPVLRTTQIWHSPSTDLEAFSDLSRTLHLHPGEDLPGQVWSTGNTVWAADFAKRSEFPRSPHAQRAQLHGAVAFPCRAEGVILGVLEFFSPQQGEPDTDLLRLLTALGTQAGQFIVRKHAKAELERQRDFALQIMNVMGQGLTVTDERGCFTFVNEAYARLVARPAQDLVGMRPCDLSPEADQERLAEARAARFRGESSSYELQLTRPDGNPCYAIVTGVPRWENGKVVGSITTVTDVSDRKRLEEQLVTNLERERELNEMKSNFVSMASHELRTPLATLSLTVDLLCMHRARLSPERIDTNLQTIRESARHLRAILDDLLFIGRGEQGKIKCKLEMVNVAELLQRISAEVGADDRNRHPIQVSLNQSPLILPLDPQILRHILVNLLSNACKYSPESSTVELQACFTDKRLELQVSDHGIGIPVEDQKKLFTYFFRARNVGDTAGTGLGLLVVKQCVEAHGGWIDFDSVPQQGTRFTVRIPVS